jgi:tetratricopeptide (TPR) repeat protein
MVGVLLPNPIRSAQNPGAQLPAIKKPAEKPAGQKQSPAEVELRNRLARAEQAKAARNPVEVARTSEQVIALALRELGQLRLLEGAAPSAAELYARSLDFENVPDTRIDLAIAHFQENHPEEAIREADRALLDDPNSARAFNVLGRAWMLKNDYPNAVRALSRAAEIAPDVESMYYLAISLLATRDPAEKARATNVFEKMEKLAGDTGSLHVLFGRAYRDAGDMPAAVREFQRAIQMDTHTPHAHYFLGLARLAANEWVATPEVKVELQKEVQLYPHDYLANYLLGFIAYNERKYEECEGHLQLAAASNPNAPDPWLYLGLNAFAQGNMQRSEECLRKAILLTGADEERSNYQIRRAYIDLGRILTASGRKEEAGPYLNKARELQNKVLATGREGMAAHLMEEGAEGAAAVVPPTKETEEGAAPVAQTKVDPFARTDPAALARSSLTDQQKQQADAQEKQLRAVLGQSFGDLATSEAIQKEYRAALSHYQEAERWDPATPDLQRNLGIAAFRVQDYGEAVRGLSAAIAANPNDAAGRAMLGMAYFGEEKFPEAAKTFAPLGKKGMEDAAVGFAWASSLAHTGEMLQAAEVLKEFEKSDRPSDTLLMTGQLWIEIGDHERAVSTLHRAQQLDPALAKAHYFAGQACIRLEHWNEAAQEFQAELARFPEDAEAKYNLGFVYMQESRNAEGEKLFWEVLAAHPDHANAQYELGKILMDRGEVKEAITHLEAAARLSPQTDYIHYQLQAAYRKDARNAEADRELEIYKHLKEQKRKQLGAALPQSPQNP